ncbi:MAG: pitrilysin family protein [Nanoarchaeota archaeon]|nr:pitrilysin family protein [Nanoarchaeota archaeon]
MKTNFKRVVLKSGLTVLFEKRDIPVVSMAYAVKQGGINESSEEKGISHFIEHMLYKGTLTRNTKQLSTEIEKNGGELNGFTTEEITAFFCKMPSETAEIGLEVLTDMIMNPLFDEKEIEKERKVIFEEIKMRKDNPRIYVFDEIQGFLYEEPFASNLIGTEKTMNALGKKELTEMFKKVYVPENLILTVVGNYEFDKLIEFVEKSFEEKFRVNSGSSDAYPKALNSGAQEIKLKNETKIEKRKGIDQVNMILAFHTPLAKDKKSYAAKVLMTLMGDGLSSRLFSEIREKRNLAYSIRGEAGISKDYSFCIIYVGTSPENTEKVKELVLKEFEKASKDISEKELSEVKKQILGNYEIGMEDSQVQMVNLIMAEYQKNAEDFYEFKEKISKVKLEDVKEIASSVEANYSFFALVPEK